MARFVILQSGFLSVESPALALSSTPTNVEEMKAIELNKPNANENASPYHYNVDVKLVVDAFRNNRNLMNDFDFRQRVLKAAKESFGTPTLLSWCGLQLNSPFLTTMHRKYILDTVDYLSTGHRSIMIDSWWELIEPRPLTQADKGADYPLKERLMNGKLTNSLADWVAQPDGYVDLLRSLDIIFGKKSKHNGSWVAA